MPNQVEVFLALGGNIGNTKQTIQQAIAEISKEIGKVLNSSSLYITAALNSPENSEFSQADYLNTVIQLQTVLTPRQTLNSIHNIEKKLGRNRNDEIRWGPRTIDIDIVTYGNIILEEEDLKIPHPNFAKRDFVLVPIKEITDNFIHPKTGDSILQMIANLEKSNLQKFIKAKLNK